jgi:NAD(P)-dependent dehydrogenase (short-subunit alcohol dehydrogenase family)
MKTIAIVGGSKGIGAALVELLKDSCELLVFSRTEIQTNEHIKHFQLDVLKDALPDTPRLDGLVYCPGSINLKPLNRLKIDDFQEDFNINVLGAIRVIQHFEKALLTAGGSVVLFSTVATQLGMPFHASIAVSKAGVEGLAKSLAAEYAAKIRFNVIAPTVTNTALAARLLRNDKQQEAMRQRHPLKTYLEAAEVAQFAKYLLSDHARAISGQVFPIDAGITTLKT